MSTSSEQRQKAAALGDLREPLPDRQGQLRATSEAPRTCTSHLALGEESVDCLAESRLS